jgi:hypothetical protein
MDDDAVVDAKGLRDEFGIKISPTHRARLEKDGKFPRRLKPNGKPKSRSYYRRKDVLRYLTPESP